MDTERWLGYCRFFKRDATLTSLEHAVTIPGLRRPLMQHQAYCIYWQLETERTASRGGFVGDGMGLGKVSDPLAGSRVRCGRAESGAHQQTMEALGLCVVERWLDIAHAHVSKARAAKDYTLHLRQGTADHPQAPDARCPSELWPICCPCVDGSPSGLLEPQCGPVLIFVPPPVIGNWLREWNSSIDECCHPVRMRLHVAHTNHAVSGPTSSFKQAIQTDDEGHARPGQGRLVVITTSKCYAKHVRQVFRKGQPATSNPAHMPTTDNSVLWGRILVDEFHQEKNYDANIPRSIRNMYAATWAYMWFYSGTPFEVSPKDLEGYISTIASVGDWPQDGILRRCTVEEVGAMHKEFKRLENQKVHDATLMGKLADRFGQLLRRLMIRRTPATKWFGEPIVRIPPHEERNVRCAFPPRFQPYLDRLTAEANAIMATHHKDRVDAWTRGGRRGPKPSERDFSKYISVAHKLRIAASIPALARLNVEDHIELTGDEMRSAQWYTDEDNPYVKNLQELVDSSNKIRRIGEIVDRLGRDVDGRPEKLLIMSMSPVVAYIITKASHLPCLPPNTLVGAR